MISAVINTDFVNSSALGKDAEKKFKGIVEKLLVPYQYEFYRGDSIQIYIKGAANSLRIALLLRSAARGLEQTNYPFDIKTSIGIGKVKLPVKSVGEAKGTAFLLSGRAFDKYIKGNKRFIIHCGSLPIDTGFEVMSSFIDHLFARVTSKQAVILFQLLSGRTQEEIARKLHNSQPTISKQANASGWNELQDLLAKFDTLIKLLPE